jgi:chemotaxis protein methyltransferase CheR
MAFAAGQFKLTSESDLIEGISGIVSKITGVQLGERQRAMVESRLKKRMIELDLKDYAQYYDYFLQHEASEVQSLVSLLTTHHTFFFREVAHFDYLAKQALPSLIENAKARGDKTIRIWSAACSRGQEVYSLSMYLDFHLKLLAPDVKYTILGTDVDSQSVAVARNGVYQFDELKSVPANYLASHWSRGTKEIADYVKAKPSIKAQCQFEVCNLLDFEKEIKSQKFDVIFCRNVFIYFTQEQIKTIASRFLDHLYPRGLLFIGLSETLNGLGVPAKSLGVSVYQAKTAETEANAILVGVGSKPASVAASTSASVKAPEFTSKVEDKVLRVLCVDDSSSILMILKQMLTKENGFEIVATAKNGLEAAAMLKKHSVDVMTLDIHMPEQTGVEYLEKNFGLNHPPVVMVTSVSRDNADLAWKALSLGASDYMEKPSLSTLSERAEELRMKLRSAFEMKQTGKITDFALDHEFKAQVVIPEPQEKVRIIVASLGDRKRWIGILKGLAHVKGQPPCYVLIHGSESALEEAIKKINHEFKLNVGYQDRFQSPSKADSIILLDFKQNFDSLQNAYSKKSASILVVGSITQNASEKIASWQGAQLLLEDTPRLKKSQLAEISDDIAPVTSYLSLSEEFFAGKRKAK